ncbi:helix-turn-helix domain-containing protein [Leptolyngbya sp. PCC 6406]|uniref:helix-turn-helix domain-containing protein n=1 Tax=Leptolyngbya sp. PCC 6406 TaxID=1173264 RepID=UPI0002ACC127|nr:helix-turn-helix domain-containing protein [Leptolyngbya sp. PCC 6406]
MASRKLSDADKQAILELYRQSQETSSSIADRYGVSNSTISRVLKQNLPEREYSRLIRQKRSGAKLESPTAAPAPPTAPVVPAPQPEVTPEPTPTAAGSVSRPEKKVPAPVRRRQSIAEPSIPTPAQKTDRDPLDLIDLDTAIAADNDEVDGDDPIVAISWEEEDSDEKAVLDADDYGDDDLDEEDLDDWDDDDSKPHAATLPRHEQLEILPFANVTFQHTYYLVVDRLSELITYPLKEFSELGQIPEEEEQARTLPVFDNHRIARRFSRRNQRVVKVPDGSVIQKTQPYLQAKGITRLLIDGNVYSLN